MRFAPYYTCNENADDQVYSGSQNDLHRIESNPKTAIFNQVR